MNSELTFKDRLRIVMSGENYTPWAQRHGISPVTVLGWLNGSTLYPKSWEKLIKATGIPKEWWISGEDKPEKINSLENDKRVRLDTDTMSSLHVNLEWQAYGNTGNDFICIPHAMDTQVDSQLTTHNSLMVNIAVNASSWRNHVDLNLEHVKVITVDSDNMQPLLQHGDQVLVNTACHTFTDDGIYAIRCGAHLRIKRIKLRLDGRIEVINDYNAGFDSELYNQDEASQFAIYGKVLPFKFGKMHI